MKETILSQINSVVGGTLEKEGRNIYSILSPDGNNRAKFRLSVMQEDGGVDLKYQVWGSNFAIPLIVAGQGAEVVAKRVLKNDPSLEIYTATQFFDFLCKEFV